MRKGYAEEYLAKKELIKQYGKENVIKLAIGEIFDFTILKPNSKEIEKIVESKGFHNKKKYYSKREKIQIERLVKYSDHGIRVEVWKKAPHRDFEIEVLYNG